mgnify:CR=1 FL=1
MKLVKDLPEIFEEFGEQKRASFLEVKKYKEAWKTGDRSLLLLFPERACQWRSGQSGGAVFFVKRYGSDRGADAAFKYLPVDQVQLWICGFRQVSFLIISQILLIGETTCDGKKKMYELMSVF